MKQFTHHHISQLVQFIKELHSIPLKNFDSIYTTSDIEDIEETTSFSEYLKKEVKERLTKKNISKSIIVNRLNNSENYLTNYTVYLTKIRHYISELFC
jgi:hypothetical protein